MVTPLPSGGRRGKHHVTYRATPTKSSSMYVASLALGASRSFSTSLARVMIRDDVNWGGEGTWMGKRGDRGLSHYEEVLHLLFLLLWSKVCKDGPSQSIHSYCQTVGVVFMG